MTAYVCKCGQSYRIDLDNEIEGERIWLGEEDAQSIYNQLGRLLNPEEKVESKPNPYEYITTDNCYYIDVLNEHFLKSSTSFKTYTYYFIFNYEGEEGKVFKLIKSEKRDYYDLETGGLGVYSTAIESYNPQYRELCEHLINISKELEGFYS